MIKKGEVEKEKERKRKEEIKRKDEKDRIQVLESHYTDTDTGRVNKIRWDR